VSKHLLVNNHEGIQKTNTIEYKIKYLSHQDHIISPKSNIPTWMIFNISANIL